MIEGILVLIGGVVILVDIRHHAGMDLQNAQGTAAIADGVRIPPLSTSIMAAMRAAIIA